MDRGGGGGRRQSTGVGEGGGGARWGGCNERRNSGGAPPPGEFDSMCEDWVRKRERERSSVWVGEREGEREGERDGTYGACDVCFVTVKKAKACVAFAVVLVSHHHTKCHIIIHSVTSSYMVNHTYRRGFCRCTGLLGASPKQAMRKTISPRPPLCPSSCAFPLFSLGAMFLSLFLSRSLSLTPHSPLSPPLFFLPCARSLSPSLPLLLLSCRAGQRKRHRHIQTHLLDPNPQCSSIAYTHRHPLTRRLMRLVRVTKFCVSPGASIRVVCIAFFVPH
jgi:hypothetical protein